VTAHKTNAIAALRSGPVDAPDSFAAIELELPPLGLHDLLVAVKAVSVNPVDVKVRASFPNDQGPRVLGFDAAGTVVETGRQAGDFQPGDLKPGDDVYYAGSIARPGSNAELQVVDARLVGRKPASLDFAQAAALPLTTITAWETLFDQLHLTRGSGGHLLVMAGAGGVGSMVTQLARALTDTSVIATASRPESIEWARTMGAHHVIDRNQLTAQVKAITPQGVNWVFSPFSTGNVETYAELMALRGQVVAIDQPEDLDILPLKQKSQSWHWESMFTRPLLEPESTYQRELLNKVARLVDAGAIRTTMNTRLTPFTADTLREAHRIVESSGAVGKVVVSRD
jgi:NADPH:quinone reductase